MVTSMPIAPQQSLKLALKQQLIATLAGGDELVADELRLLLKVRNPQSPDTERSKS